MKKAKAFKLLFLLSFIYEDLKKLTADLLRGKPETDGVFLLGPNTEIKLRLIDYLSKQQYRFTIYGDGKNVIPCKHINITSNHIYIYSHSYKYSNISICIPTEGQGSFLKMVLNTIKIPFYLKYRGYQSVHFEVFGDYHNNSQVDLNIDNTFPLGSTLIITATINNMNLHSVSEELILKNFVPYTNNPYIRYINYLITNTENNTFSISMPSRIYFFKISTEKLTNFSNSFVLNWQLEQIRDFITFFYRITDTLRGKKELEFSNFILKYLFDDHNLANASEGLLNFLNSNLVRYKELLLFSFIANNEIEKVQALLSNNVDINSSLISGATPLYASVHLGIIAITRLLISLGASIDSPTINKVTPLMISSLNNFVDITELLLSSGANPNVYDINNNSPLILSSLKGHSKIVELLIKFHADVNSKNIAGNTALAVASSLGHINVMVNLLKAGANLDDTDNNGYTPLMLAVLNMQTNSAKLLVKYEANINIQNYNGETPLIIAINNADIKLVEVLLNSGADINLKANDQLSIILALNERHFSIARLLLDHDNLSIMHSITDNKCPKLEFYGYLFVNYILNNTYNSLQALKSMADIEYYDKSYEYIEYVSQIKSCLFELDHTTSYRNLLELCGNYYQQTEV